MQFNEILALANNPAFSAAQIERALVDAHQKAAASVAAVGRAQEAYDRAALGNSLSEAIGAKERLLMAQVARERLSALIRLLERRAALANTVAEPGGDLSQFFPGLSKQC